MNMYSFAVNMLLWIAQNSLVLLSICIMYSVLQCVAVFCSVLQCVAVCIVCCGVLQCVTVCGSVLQCVVVCCIVIVLLSTCTFTNMHTYMYSKHYVQILIYVYVCVFFLKIYLYEHANIPVLNMTVHTYM